tara:strand:- start:2754 stop:3602 length:849 start_codon:yes stop_codon:yes gene_type:complete
MAISIAISNSIGARDNAPSGGGGFVWVNSEAEAYYNAVTVANGGDVDTVALYGQTLNDTKQAIDTRVTDLKSALIFNKLVHDYPFFGGTSNTHAICAIDYIPELTYFGSPTHSSLGMVLNGAGQYASMNNSISNEVPSTTDWAIGIDLNSSTNKIMMGSRDATNIGAVIRYRLSTLIGYATNSGLTVSPAISSIGDSFLVLSQADELTARLYVDSLEISTSTSNGLLPTTYPSFIGAWNNIGGVVEACAGNVKFSFESAGLSPLQVTALEGINNTFQTFLGR